MIKENQKYFNWMHVVIDACILCLSYYLAYTIRFTFEIIPIKGLYFPPFFPDMVGSNNLLQALLLRGSYVKYLPLILVIYLLTYFYFQLYSPKRYSSRRFEFFNLIKSNVVATLFFILCLYLTKPGFLSRSFIFIFVVLNLLLDYASRDFIRKWLRKTRKLGRNLKHIIIVGFSSAGAAYIDRMKLNPQWGYKLHGILDDNVTPDFEYQNIPWIGKTCDLTEYLEQHSLDEVAITISIREYEKLEGLVKVCEKSGVHTKFVPDYSNFISTNPYTEDLNGLPVINIRNVPLTNTVNKIVKRTIDIIGSIVAITLFSPIMLIVAILVKKSSPGPIIFKQVRIGLGGKEFNMYKFRSMGVQAAGKEKTEWTTSNDPRVTPVGKVIRKTSIDEFPQFFNVLKGDMSLVGPRPERPYFVEKFKEEIPRYMIKHQVRPGITGWAQVSGYRGDTSIRGRIDHDLYYIENWSLSLDIKILFLTIFKGFVNENAY